MLLSQGVNFPTETCPSGLCFPKMTRKFKPKPPSVITPPKKFGGGKNEGFVADTWLELARARCRVDMFRALTRLDIGVNEVEDYNASLNLKLRSKYKNKGIYSNREVVRAAMKGKLKDAVQTANEVTRKRDEERRKIKKKHGPKTSTTRKILRTFREEAEEIKKKTIEDYKMKISHFRTKHEKLRREEKKKYLKK